MELSSAVDVPVNVSTVWTGPDGVTITTVTNSVMESLTRYTSTALVSSFGREKSGNYTCRDSISSTSPYLVGSPLMTGTTRVTVGEVLGTKILHVKDLTSTYIIMLLFSYNFHRCLPLPKECGLC